jgi:hypothetical protein
MPLARPRCAGRSELRGEVLQDRRHALVGDDDQRAAVVAPDAQPPFVPCLIGHRQLPLGHATTGEAYIDAGEPAHRGTRPTRAAPAATAADNRALWTAQMPLLFADYKPIRDEFKDVYLAQ